MDKDQIIAVIRLLTTLVIGALTAWGINVDANMVAVAIGGIVTLICFVWAWWKNNNITIAARDAQKLLEQLKTEEKLTEAAE